VEWERWIAVCSSFALAVAMIGLSLAAALADVDRKRDDVRQTNRWTP
jgi:hypothetical protein